MGPEALNLRAAERPEDDRSHQPQKCWAPPSTPDILTYIAFRLERKNPRL